jgi:manganese oxidase
MADYQTSPPNSLWHRRQILKAGLTGLGLTGIGAGLYQLQGCQAGRAVAIPPIPENTPTGGNGISPMRLLRQFDYGTLKQDKGRTVREFQVTAQNITLQLNSVVSFPSWNYNGRVPGPILRAKAGERVRVVFLNKSGHAHTMHFHGEHPAAMDGIKPIRNDTATIYEFDAEPFGLHLYHCHVEPVPRHIGKGLYGMFIIDPPNGRPPADEIVLVMAGYDINGDQKNELYAFNAIPDYYMQNPISIYQDQLVRLYVLNMIEYDPVATFHLHANFFQVYLTGLTLTPSHTADVITMGTTERHILEFSYKTPGKYMFHPHQDAIAEAGCMGVFNVIPKKV